MREKGRSKRQTTHQERKKKKENRIAQSMNYDPLKGKEQQERERAQEEEEEDGGNCYARFTLSRSTG